MSNDASEQNGQLHTLGLIEQLRAECKGLWGASSSAYFRVDELLRELRNPMLRGQCDQAGASAAKERIGTDQQTSISSPPQPAAAS